MIGNRHHKNNIKLITFLIFLFGDKLKMSEQFENEKELYYHKSRAPRLYCFHVEAEPDKPWDYEYLFQKNIYPGLGKEKAAVEKWIDIFPPDKLNFSALSQHHHIDDSWIYQFPLADWNLYKLSMNGKFSFRMAFHCPEFISRNWDWSQIKFEPNDVFLDTYLNVLKKTWHIGNYATTHIITEWIQHIPETEEIYHHLSKNRYLETDWLLAKPNAPWDVKELFLKKSNEKSQWYLIVNSDKWPFAEMSPHHGVTLETLKHYPKAPWNFPLFSRSYSVSLEWLLAFPEANWNFQELSQNYYLNLKWLQAFPNADWNFTVISQNHRISIEWVECFPAAPWDYHKITKYINLDYRWVELFPKIPWDFQEISSKIREPIKWLNKFPAADWNYHSILRRNDVTLELITQIPHGKIDFDLLSENPNLTPEWIHYYPEESWNFIKISMHRDITLEWIEAFPSRSGTADSHKAPNTNWSFRADDWNQNKFTSTTSKSSHTNDGWGSRHQGRLRNYNITDFYRDKFQISWFEKFPDMKWDYSHICNCFNITLEFLQKYPDKPWDFGELSYNKYVTLEFLDAFPDADWDFEVLSFHPNLKLRWLEGHGPKNNTHPSWDYQKITHHKNFNINWLERFPREDWNVNELVSRLNPLYSLVLYQFYHPDICVMDKISPHHRYSLNRKIRIPLMLLHPESKNYFPGDVDKLGFWKTQELKDEEKWNVVRLAQAKYNFNHFYPDIIYHIDTPLELQDLSGEIFQIPGWFDCDDIMGLACQTLLDIGIFEIVIEQPQAEEDFMVSRHTNQDLKRLLLSMVDGPFGMLVYMDNDSMSTILPSQEEENEFKYFEMW